MKILLRWLINSAALLLIAYLVAGISVTSFYIAIITALILGLVNAIIRPILVVLTLPINVLTLGLFVLVINAALFWFVSTFIQGFEVDGIKAAFFGALIMSVVSWISNWVLRK